MDSDRKWTKNIDVDILRNSIFLQAIYIEKNKTYISNQPLFTAYSGITSLQAAASMTDGSCMCMLTSTVRVFNGINSLHHRFI